MTTPPIGANLWIWDSPVTTDVIRERAPQVAAMGFDAIELPLETAVDWSAREVKPILDATGLAPGVCAAMGPGRDLTTDDARTVDGTQSYLRSCIEHAAAIGASVVSGPIYTPTGQTGAISADDRARKLELLVKNFAPVLEIAGAHGVRLALEPLNRFETSLFNTVAQTMALIDAVGHPALGLLLDTFHMNIEERDIGAAIRLAGDRLVHVHACGNDRGAPGHDGIDWTAVRDALRDIGYAGAVTIESFTSANKTLATAASIWRPLATSQDALAADGLAFLREVFSRDPAGQ
ncbi:MAG TPA: sugar phosphate isomerase/epimerase family protein [Thermomicrobiales bacterium]|nr:sugar phosphate isomerase/epimerase family protein [Thermomicrobiales bacterium]